MEPTLLNPTAESWDTMAGMWVLNCTPHPITIRSEDGDITIQPCGQVARVEMEESVVGSADSIPLISRKPGGIVGLPDEKHCHFLVSSMVLDASQGNPRLLAPDTGSTAIRDDAGRIIAVTRLVRADSSQKDESEARVLKLVDQIHQLKGELAALKKDAWIGREAIQQELVKVVNQTTGTVESPDGKGERFTTRNVVVPFR